MPKTIPALSLNFPDQEQIWQWLTAHGTPQQVALRGRIVLAAAEGQSESGIARQLGTNRKTVRLWRTRLPTSSRAPARRIGGAPIGPSSDWGPTARRWPFRSLLVPLPQQFGLPRP